MPETNRPGAAVDVLSIRVNDTLPASAASAFFDTKTRPVAVAAQSVELSPVVRATATT